MDGIRNNSRIGVTGDFDYTLESTTTNTSWTDTPWSLKKKKTDTRGNWGENGHALLFGRVPEWDGTGNICENQHEDIRCVCDLREWRSGVDYETNLRLSDTAKPTR